MTRNRKRLNPVVLLPLFVAVAFLLVLAATSAGSTAAWGGAMVLLLAVAVVAGAALSRSDREGPR